MGRFREEPLRFQWSACGAFTRRHKFQTMKDTFLKSPAPTFLALTPAATALRNIVVPLVAFVALLLALSCTTPGSGGPNAQTPLEMFAHHLGHEINSIWVGVGLLALVIPSLVARSRGQIDTWAWRALDAIMLDFLVIDAFCRRFIPWPRPGDPTHAGFPSGHTTFAFMMAWLVWQRYPKLGLPWFAMAVLIGWSRAEVNAHFPYQIVVGALLGCTLGALITTRKAGVFLPRVLLSDATLNRRLSPGQTA